MSLWFFISFPSFQKWVHSWKHEEVNMHLSMLHTRKIFWWISHLADFRSVHLWPLLRARRWHARLLFHAGRITSHDDVIGPRGGSESGRQASAGEPRKAAENVPRVGAMQIQATSQSEMTSHRILTEATNRRWRSVLCRRSEPIRGGVSLYLGQTNQS